MASTTASMPRESLPMSVQDILERDAVAELHALLPRHPHLLKMSFIPEDRNIISYAAEYLAHNCIGMLLTALQGLSGEELKVAVNHRDNKHRTPLAWTFKKVLGSAPNWHTAFVQVVRSLLIHGADPTIIDSGGNTLVHPIAQYVTDRTAVRTSFLFVCNALKKQGYVQKPELAEILNAENEEQYSALDLAFFSSNIPMLELLLSTTQLFLDEGALQTGVWNACAAGKADVLHTVFAYVRNKGLVDKVLKFENGSAAMTGLTKAILSDHEEVVSVLLKHGADIYYKAPRHGAKTAFHQLMTSSNLSKNTVHSIWQQAVSDATKDARHFRENISKHQDWAMMLAGAAYYDYGPIVAALWNRDDPIMWEAVLWGWIQGGHKARLETHLSTFSDENLLSCQRSQIMPNQDDYPINQGTALHLAAKQGHKEITELLVNELKKRRLLRKARMARDGDGYTPLLAAIYRNHVPVAQILASEDNKEQDRKMMDAEGSNVVHCAVDFDPVKANDLQSAQGMIHWVKQHFGPVDDLLAQRNKLGWLPLATAVSRGHVAIAELLAAHDGQNGDPMANEPRRETYLHVAARSGSSAMVEWVLKHRGGEQHRTTLGSEDGTPLALAIRGDHLSAAQALARNDPHREEDYKLLGGSEAIWLYSWEEDSPGIIRWMLDHFHEHRHDLLNKKDEDGDIPLAVAIQYGYLTTVELLCGPEYLPYYYSPSNLGRRGLEYLASWRAEPETDLSSDPKPDSGSSQRARSESSQRARSESSQRARSESSQRSRSKTSQRSRSKTSQTSSEVAQAELDRRKVYQKNGLAHHAVCCDLKTTKWVLEKWKEYLPELLMVVDSDGNIPMCDAIHSKNVRMVECLLRKPKTPSEKTAIYRQLLFKNKDGYNAVDLCIDARYENGGKKSIEILRLLLALIEWWVIANPGIIHVLLADSWLVKRTPVQHAEHRDWEEGKRLIEELKRKYSGLKPYGHDDQSPPPSQPPTQSPTIWNSVLCRPDSDYIHDWAEGGSGSH